MAGLGDYRPYPWADVRPGPLGIPRGGEVGELLTLAEYRAMIWRKPAYVRDSHVSNTREGKQEFKHRPRGQGRKRRRW